MPVIGACIWKGCDVNRVDSSIEKLLAEEALAAEAAEAVVDVRAPLPGDVVATRGGPRVRNLQVRLREDEYQAVADHARSLGLPLSTAVRRVLLQAAAPTDDLAAALDRLESDVAAVRRTVSRG